MKFGQPFIRKSIFSIALLLGTCGQAMATPPNKVVCFVNPPEADSTFTRMNKGACNDLATSLAPHGIVVVQKSLDFFHTRDTFKQATDDNDVFALIYSASAYNPNAVQSAVDNRKVLHIFSRMALNPNEVLPVNAINVSYLDRIAWYLKGVLAAKVSPSNNFTIMVPRIDPEYLSSTNFYYAGLKSENPNANLTAYYTFRFFSIDDTPPGNIGYTTRSVRDQRGIQVLAGFYSQLFNTQEMLAKYPQLKMIESQFGVSSPASDISVVDNPNVLTWTQWNFAPHFKDLILSAANGNFPETSYLNVRNEAARPVTELARFSSAIQSNIRQDLLNKERELLTEDPLVNGVPTLYCSASMQILSGVYPMTNGCLRENDLFEKTCLHPDIPIINITNPFQAMPPLGTCQ